MKLYQIEEGTPCFVVANVKVFTSFIPFITTRDNTFDTYCLTEQSYRLYGDNFGEMALEGEWDKDLIDKTVRMVSDKGYMAFTTLNRNDEVSLMLVDAQLVEVIC